MWFIQDYRKYGQREDILEEKEINETVESPTYRTNTIIIINVIKYYMVIKNKVLNQK